MKIRIPYRLKKTHTALFAATLVMCAALLGPVSVEAAPKARQQKQQHEFTVVIDAGHGGHDHGAIDNGAREKDINLGVAKKLAALVRKKMKDVKVVMTRDDDTFVSLQERANIANRNKGNLFISIHTNSVDKSNPNRRKVAGTSVYALGPQKDANNLRVAQRENSVIELESNYNQKYSGFDPSKDESYIIFEMAQKKSLGQSLRFADKAQKELVKTAAREDRGVKQAGFWVLWATSMPSVLVELDFICNPKTAGYLASESGQQQLAQSLYNALDQYVESLGNPAAADIASAQVKPAAETSMADAADETPTVGTLVAQEKKENTRRDHVAQARTRSGSSAQRRRRSDSARRASDSRDLAAEKIELKSETDWLVRQEKPEVKKEEPAPEPEKNPKDKNKKKKKKNGKSSKKKADAKKTEAKPDKKSGTKSDSKRKGSNTRTITVKSSGGKGGITPVVSEGGTRAAAAAAAPYASGMTYQIVLVASERELPSDDPAFCGLKPTGSFVENGLHKYTYGDTANRREIEQRLLEVKTLIPEAVIIVRSK